MQVRIKFSLCNKRILSALNAIVDFPTWARSKAETELLSLESSTQTYEDQLDILSEKLTHSFFDMGNLDLDIDKMKQSATDLVDRVHRIIDRSRNEIQEKINTCNNLKARVDFSLYNINKICFEDYNNDSNFDAERQHLTELKERLEQVDTNITNECLKNISLLSTLQFEAESLLNEINSKILANYK